VLGPLPTRQMHTRHDGHRQQSTPRTSRSASGFLRGRRSQRFCRAIPLATEVIIAADMEGSRSFF
jgi:hypothetical protein